MNPLDFIQLIVRSAPSWLQRTIGRAWLSIFGEGIDLLNEQSVQSMEARFARYASEDALAMIALDRMVLKCPSETVAEYRAQLQRAWYWQGIRGTDEGLIQSFARAGLTLSIFRIIDTAGTPTTATSTRWLVIQLPHDFGPSPLIGSFTIGDGTTLGPQEPIAGTFAYLRAVLDRFAASHWNIKGVWLVTDDPLAEGPVDDTWNGSELFATSCTLQRII